MYEEELINSIENPDSQLAAEAQAGDMMAEEKLIRKYSGVVSRKAKAFYMAGADAEDVMQEGMIGLLKAVRKYKPGKKASFATFAEICITSQIISAIRSAERNKNKPLNNSVSLSKPIGSFSGGSTGSEGGGGEGVEGITLEDTISANLADSPEQMLILKDVTHYILQNGDNVFSNFEMEVIKETTKGYSYDQIAERLGKSPKSIDNALQRAKKKINSYLWK